MASSTAFICYYLITLHADFAPGRREGHAKVWTAAPRVLAATRESAWQHGCLGRRGVDDWRAASWYYSCLRREQTLRRELAYSKPVGLSVASILRWDWEGARAQVKCWRNQDLTQWYTYMLLLWYYQSEAFPLVKCIRRIHFGLGWFHVNRSTFDE